jgi:hypothetical protein
MEFESYLWSLYGLYRYVLGQLNPLHTLTYNFFKINFHVIRPSTSRF